MRTQQGLDSRHHDLGNQHHLQTERARDIHERRRTRRGGSLFDVAISGAGYAGQISDLLLRHGSGEPSMPEKPTDFMQNFRIRFYDDTYTIHGHI
jgi:hypothetical protein